MILRDEECSLVLKVLEIVPPGTPDADDVRLEVVARAEGFSGRNKDAWVGRTKIETFLASLDEMAELDIGKAELASMSPADFFLHIEARGLLDPVEAVGFVGRQKRYLRRWRESRVEFDIALDPLKLDELATGFRKLLDVIPRRA